MVKVYSIAGTGATPPGWHRYVSAEDYEALLFRAKDWMRHYGMLAQRAPDRTERDIQDFLIGSALDVPDGEGK